MELLKNGFRTFGPLACLAMGVFVTAAGVLHVMNPWHFLDSINDYRILPISAAAIVASTLPLIQVTLGTFLLFGFSRKLSMYALCLMFGMFFMAEVSALLRSLDISCGCFGSLSPTITWKTASVTLALMVSSGMFAIYLPGFGGELLSDSTDEPK